MGAVVGFLLSRMELWLVAAIAYFCGCFNGAVIISKYILRDDVRTHGSGNAGLTNFYRTFGGPLTLVVILCDVLKAVVAILIAAKIGSGFDPAHDAGMCLWMRRMAAFLRGPVQVLGSAVLPAGSYVPLHVPFQGRQGHPLRRRHRADDGLAHCPGGLGRIFGSGDSDPVRVPGISLGRRQLSLYLLVLLPEPDHCGAGLCHRRSGGLAAPGQCQAASHRYGTEVQLPQKTEGST